jgi:hypothetical protein
MELDLRNLDVDRIASYADVMADSVVEALNPNGLVAFDIETAPLDESLLLADMQPFPPLEPFDEAAVKIGNLKDARKIAEKLATAREMHAVNWQKKKAEYEREYIEKAALDPLRGSVLVIGYGDADGRRIIHAADEADLLTELWSIFYSVVRNNGQLVGWNCHKFDLPFCRKRSYLHGLPVPTELLKRGRNWHESVVDLMVEWCSGEYGAYAGLERVAKFLGVGGKVGGEGADFARLWDEERDTAVAYLTGDIDMTMAVAKRLGF